MTGCSAAGNLAGTAVGFSVGSGCTLSNCTATGHAGDGFQFVTGCLLVGNTARNNNTDGFHGSGISNRIDSNLAQLNSGRGIHSSTATADQIIRNTSIGNSVGQYNPATGNNVGPTTGNPATSTSPWANF